MSNLDSFESTLPILDRVINCMLITGYTASDLLHTKIIISNFINSFYEKLILFYGKNPHSYVNLTSLLKPYVSVVKLNREHDFIRTSFHVLMNAFEFLRFDGIKDIILQSKNYKQILVQLLSLYVIIFQYFHNLYPISWTLIKLKIFKSGITFY